MCIRDRGLRVPCPPRLHQPPSPAAGPSDTRRVAQSACQGRLLVGAPPGKQCNSGQVPLSLSGDGS
eukprot:7602041-Alexandrium_andersonii.AAC.1